jgi:hypothetical protein
VSNPTDLSGHIRLFSPQEYEARKAENRPVYTARLERMFSNTAELTKFLGSTSVLVWQDLGVYEAVRATNVIRRVRPEDISDVLGAPLEVESRFSPQTTILLQLLNESLQKDFADVWLPDFTKPIAAPEGFQ